jgi:hypothetical protein
MRLLKQALGVLGALVVLAVIVAFVAPKKAHALAAALVQIVPGTTTHVGQNESQLVSLFCVEHTSFCSEESPAGGDDLGTPYVVPAGFTLIVTDYAWTSFCGSTANANTFNQADFLVNGANGPSGAPYFSSFQFALSDKNGTAALTLHFASGLKMASGATPQDFEANSGCGEASIHGYLVPN